ncbi:2Fe-2S iron-sulfur cluster-binding protein [Streptomyces yangpuensis]|uniref:(2Fe-2S)-binding protein n=1 Tax=Streptomyces yangpuensis TaxID=1648182 RepID=UPI00342719CD
MEFEVNGARRTVDVDGDPAAVDVVRDRLGLTGTKLVCAGGVCGACTIQVDGEPRVSCLTPAARLAGRRVTTVEGLSGHPVARAFAAEDALQCGYCTPGFVVEAAAFVERWRALHGTARPGRDQIAEALAGHLCRCGAYEGIFRAVAAACAGDHDTAPTGSAPDGAGAAAVPRVEAPEKTDGSARYTTDLHPDGLLEGVIIRSPHAHAHVRSLEAGDLPLVPLLPPTAWSVTSGSRSPPSRGPTGPPHGRRPRASPWTTRCCPRPWTRAWPERAKARRSTRTRRPASGPPDQGRPPNWSPPAGGATCGARPP